MKNKIVRTTQLKFGAWIIFSIMLFTSKIALAQTPISTVCNSATGVCTGSVYSFAASTNAGSAQSGAAYGCLTTQPNPAWFFMQIQNSGSITISMSSSPAKDIDFIIWGPFTNPFAQCMSGLSAAKIVSCSYSRASTETGIIPSGVSGQYYVLLITNYSNSATNITFSQTSGTGTSNCDILCNITSLSASSTACGAGAQLGTYTVSGTVTSFSPPSSGTLTVSSSCGGSVSYNAPFASTINYTLPTLAGKGDTCVITAAYSTVSTCTKSVSVVTPVCCTIVPGSNVTACEGQSAQLSASGTSGGVYHWSGPNSFTSTQQNPTMNNVSLTQAGTYQVYLVNGGCTTSTKSVGVTINAKPSVKQIIHE